MNFDNNTPIYLQIMEKIKEDIFSGKLKPKDRISSVRDLAVKFSVNPNTVQKALGELEREGTIYSERTSGRYVTEDGNHIEKERRKMANELIENFLAKMQLLGFTEKEIAALITNLRKDKKNGK